MAPPTGNKPPISKRPLESYEHNHIMTREKKVIADELQREHKRANDLVQELKKLQTKVSELGNKTTTVAPSSEKDNDAKTRLNGVLEAVIQKLSEVKFTEAEKLFLPAKVDVLLYGETNVDDNTDESMQIENSNEDRKTYKLDPNTKTFSGSPGERLSQWLFIIHEAFTAINVSSDKMKLALITNYVKGAALNSLIRYKSQPYPTWIGFTQLLKEQYEDTNLDFKLRTQFFHLKMDSGFPKYLQRFQELINQLPSLGNDPQNILDKFTDGLAKEYAFAVRREKCETLNQAIEVCNDLSCLTSNYNETNKHEQVNYTKTQFNKGQKTRNYYSGDKANYSSLRMNNKPFKKFEVKKPHNSKKAFPSKTTWKGKANSEKKIDLSKIICAICKKAGHFANRCFLKQKKQNKVYTISVQSNNSRTLDNNLLNVNGHLNGIPTVFTLDTAATTCVISEKFAKANAIEIFKSDIKVRVANNDLVDVVGKTAKLHIEVKSHTCDLEMFVLPNTEFEVLLGLKWFMETGCSINPSQRSLQFKSEIFSLDNEEEALGMEDENVFLTEIDPTETDDIDTYQDWSDNPFKGIKPESELSPNEWIEVKKLDEKIKNGFATSLKDLGKCDILPYKIKLTSDEIVNIPQYRKSIVDHEYIQKYVEEMEEAGLIRKSNSPYSSPLLLVPKKNGERRLVTDFRSLNKITQPENLPTPLVRDIFDRVSGSKWFSLFDLTSGYNQIVLHKDSRKYTSFCTRTNKYMYNVLPFGLKNAVGGFCKIMEMTVGHLSSCCLPYVDDLICFSPTFKQHCLDIEKIFKALEKSKLKVNPSKCVWMTKELKLLGHIINGKELKVDPSKVKAIEERLPPTNVKETQIFLGCTGYYRSMIKDYAKIAKPLYDLLKKDVKFEWELEHQNAFDALKNKLKEYPIVRLPLFKQPFKVYCDSSGFAIGSVLAQVDPETGQEYAVCYASRLLKETERYYSICERELLSIVYSLNLWKIYLCKKFTVVTDAKAITYLMTQKSPNMRLVRYMIFLQAFDFDIVYRKGSENKVADFLSRPTRINWEEKSQKILSLQTMEEINEDEEISSRKLDAWDDESLIHYLTYGRHVSGISQKQKRRIDKIHNHYKIDGRW